MDDSISKKKLNPMMAKANIMVSRPSINPRLNISMEAASQVKNFFFFDKGLTSVRAVFDKDSYNVGETAHVECFVDNTKCLKTIRCLKIKFRRLLKGNASENTSFSNE